MRHTADDCRIFMSTLSDARLASLISRGVSLENRIHVDILAAPPTNRRINWKRSRRTPCKLRAGNLSIPPIRGISQWVVKAEELDKRSNVLGARPAAGGGSIFDHNQAPLSMLRKAYAAKSVRR